MPIGHDETASERRSNLELRAAIDEMLERIRELRRRAGTWTADERAQAARDLEGVMSRLRNAAVRRD